MVSLEEEIRARLKLADKISRSGYEIARSMQEGVHEFLKIDAKGRPTFLTEADTRVETFLSESILRHFPEDTIIGEEGADQLGTVGGFCWILDPIDGTDNYSRRIQPWAVSVGVLRDGLPVVAAVAVEDRVYSTWRGAGYVFCDDRIWMPSEWRPRERWIIGFEGLKRLTESEALVRQLWSNSHQTRTLSSCIGQAIYVLDGRIDGHVECGAALWDIAAITLLLREAGLKLTRWDGNDVFPHAWDVATRDLSAYRQNYGLFDFVAAYPRVHEKLLELIAPWAGELEQRLDTK